MNNNSSKATQSWKRSLGLKRYVLLLTAVWTLTVGVSLTWNYFRERDAARQAAIVAARAQFTKDVIYRRWNASHGGVYVPVSESIQPNPYLTDVEERDIETPSGRRLTLINPAYMTRLVHELGWEAEGVRGHITSLDPIRPANAPDAWEKRALERFEGGAQEFASVETLDGEAHLRLMRPLMTEKGCLKCHAKHGYKEGDVRGGISVSMPMAPYAAIARENMTIIGVGHGTLWLLGLAALAFGTRHIQQRVRERDRVEEELRESELFQRTLLETSPDFVSVLDANGTILRVNRVQPGHRKEDVVGQRASTFIPPEYQDAIERAFRQALDTRQLQTVETMVDLPDGRHYFLNRLNPVHLTGGEVSVVLIATDITERVRAEEALRELNATLETQVAARTAEIRVEKERSEIILRSVGDAIMMFDRELRIQYVNPTFTTLTGYTAEEVLGQHASSVGAAAGSEQVQQSIESALAEGRQWQGEASSQRKDGRVYDAALIISPLRDAEGNLMGYVSSHRGISQRKALERARSRFLDNVSHQLRTPVTTLQLYAHLMQQTEMSEKSRDYLRAMRREIDWLIQLMQDILEMTALDSGKAVTAWKPVSLPAMIENAIARYQSQVKTSGLTMAAVPLPPDLPVVEGDPARLAQALGEVVENAIVFTPSGGQVTLQVETVEDEGSTWVTVAVQDTGPGIPPEEQERVFDRFFRGSLAESGHIPGVGLGLSIAQEIMRAHGGRVTVESGQAGSTFKLWLPVGAA